MEGDEHVLKVALVAVDLLVRTPCEKYHCGCPIGVECSHADTPFLHLENTSFALKPS